MSSSLGPLHGVRVLDLSRILAGPYCTMILGDLGADVIKVEQPGKGDDTRTWGPPWHGTESAYYLSVNRNKRGITLDLKHPDAQQIVRELAAVSDIVVENFKPGTLERMHIGYQQLSQVNPRLIWATVSGYGPVGPLADKPGYDFVAQGEAGVMGITGEPDGEPMKVGVAIVDITTGMFTAIAVLAALRAKEREGIGQKIDTSLLASAIAWLGNVAQNHLVSGLPAKRFGNAHPNIVPYQVFNTADQHITIAVGNDRQFRSLCSILGLEHLADDPAYATNPARVANRDTLVPILQAAFNTRTAAEWLDACDKAGIPSGSINTIEQVFQHAQVLANGLVQSVDHPAGDLKLVSAPYRLSETPAVIRRPPPLLGQHTDEILGDVLSRSPDEVARLHQSGAV